MGMTNRARLFAAAGFAALIATAPALAQDAAGQGGDDGDVYGKEVPLDGDGKSVSSGKAGEAGKAGKAVKAAKTGAKGGQTAAQPRQGGDDGGYGVERPLPEGGDPNGGDGNGAGSGGGDGDDLPPGDGDGSGDSVPPHNE